MWFLLFYFTTYLVVSQEYSTKAEDEYVIVGNDVLMKCKVPSFVSDQVTVINWIDNQGETLYSGSEYSKTIFAAWNQIMGHTSIFPNSNFFALKKDFRIS